MPCNADFIRKLQIKLIWYKRQLLTDNRMLIADSNIWRDAGAVELDSLENCCGASHRGFESHSLRFFDCYATVRCLLHFIIPIPKNKIALGDFDIL